MALKPWIRVGIHMVHLPSVVCITTPEPESEPATVLFKGGGELELSDRQTAARLITAMIEAIGMENIANLDAKRPGR